ncbi:MAG TPA: flavodoxin domain-containing protein [Phototrophicaceae bacterium]|nr:flavodoxin domain-containing protein [Phototrophicaceae bacterium]
MDKPILVTYATRSGSTAEVATMIAKTLEHDGQAVEICPLEDVGTISGYSAIVVGSPIRDRQWLPEVSDFIDAYHERLSQLPVAYFTVCKTLREDTLEHRQIVWDYCQPLLHDFADVHPIAVGMFAGEVDYRKLPLLTVVKARLSNIPAGDWRCWTKIEAWAHDLAFMLDTLPQPI